MKMMSRAGLVVLLAAATVESASSQTPRLNQVMRNKLDQSQKILETLVTSNWQEMDRHSRELARATQDPGWSVLKTPEYVQHSVAFVRATDDLIAAANRHDLEAASLGFISLTTSCINCHRYLTRSRIASKGR
jgi:hypothetical protein